MKHLSLIALGLAIVGCECPRQFISQRANEWAASVVQSDKRPRIKSEVLEGRWKADDGHLLVFGKHGSLQESRGSARATGTYRLEAYKLIVEGSCDQRWIVLEDHRTLLICNEKRELKRFVRL